jgi:hypothetical protein
MVIRKNDAKQVDWPAVLALAAYASIFLLLVAFVFWVVFYFDISKLRVGES